MKVIFGVLLFVLTASPLWASDAAQYSANDPVNLSPKELEALRLASSWSELPINPIQTEGGKVVYMHGFSMPTIIGAPMQISDIEFEPGEVINEILVGDNSRWLVESGSSGSGVAHIFVKPLYADLQTSLVVTTNKRVYHLKLVSKADNHTPYIGFLYAEQAKILAARDQKQKVWSTVEIDGQTVDLSGLDFNYQVRGKASWKPVQVYNNGSQTFLKLPDSASKKEVPVLLAMNGKKEQLVNYRVHNNTFVVDGLFDHLALITGVGRDQVRVDIKRSVKK